MTKLRVAKGKYLKEKFEHDEVKRPLGRNTSVNVSPLREEGEVNVGRNCEQVHSD